MIRSRGTCHPGPGGAIEPRTSCRLPATGCPGRRHVGRAVTACESGPYRNGRHEVGHAVKASLSCGASGRHAEVPPDRPRSLPGIRSRIGVAPGCRARPSCSEIFGAMPVHRPRGPGSMSERRDFVSRRRGAGTLVIRANPAGAFRLRLSSTDEILKYPEETTPREPVHRPVPRRPVWPQRSIALRQAMVRISGIGRS